MSNKLKTVIITLILAFAYVLTDITSAMAFGLDPSEIKIAEIVQKVPTSVLVGGTAATIAAGYKIIRTWIFADGHTERAPEQKK